MEKITIKADNRSETGKGSARSLRRAGILPAIVYSQGGSTAIKVNAKEMTKLIYSGVGEHALITIELEKDGQKVEHPVLVKDFQRDPVSEELLHVDFFEISLKDKITISVNLEIVKQPIGIKKGGTLQKRLREIEIECLPTNIPEKIAIDAEHIDIGQTFHVSDIVPIEGIRIITEGSLAILSVTAKVVADTEEAGEEKAAEPEIVGTKGKGEEEAEKEGK